MPSRLTKEGTLRRLRRGVYHFPQINEKLGITLSPTPDAIAQALARGHRSSLQIAGAQAANLLGLSEQVPAHIVYLTDVAAKLRAAASGKPESVRSVRVTGGVPLSLELLMRQNDIYFVTAERR